MDLWKWVAVAAAALVGVFVFLGILPRSDVNPTPQAVSNVENGSFVLEQGTVQLVQENFLMSTVGQFIDLHSTISVNEAGQTNRYTQRLRLGSNFEPVRYFRDTQAPPGQQTVLAEFQAADVRVNRFSEGQAEERQLSGSPPFVVLDDDAISHYLILYRYILGKAQQGQRFEGTAIKPQAMQSQPIQAETPKSAMLKSGEQLISVEKISVEVGSTQLILYGQNGTLFAVAFPAQQSIAYRNDLLPSGVDTVLNP